MARPHLRRRDAGRATGAMRSADAPDADGPPTCATRWPSRPVPRPRRHSAWWCASPGRGAAGRLGMHKVDHRGPQRLRRSAARRDRRRLAGPKTRRTSASCAPPRHRGSTSSRPTRAATRWRSTPAWPPARGPWCSRRWVRATPGAAVVDGGAPALRRRDRRRGVHPGAQRAGRRGLRPRPRHGGRRGGDGAGAAPAQARVLLMAALAAGYPSPTSSAGGADTASACMPPT